MTAKIPIRSPLRRAHSSPMAPSRLEAVSMTKLSLGRDTIVIVLRWSERGDSLGDGAEKNPNAWRRLGSRSRIGPCLAGTERLSLFERGYIYFTPGGGERECEGGGNGKRGIYTPNDMTSTRGKKKKSRPLLAQARNASKAERSSSGWSRSS